MEITLYNRTNTDVSAYEARFIQIARSAEKILKLKEDYLLSVTFVRSRTIHQINRDFRGIPFGFHFIRFWQAVLPVCLFDFVFGTIFGIYHTMDHFTGRKK